MVQRVSRLGELKQRKRLDAFLLTSQPSVKCFSGYFFNFETGPSPFQLLPAALVTVSNSESTLLIADTESHQLSTLRSGITVRSYISYTYDKPLDFERQFLIQLHDIIKEGKLQNARLGIEIDAIPAVITQSLHSRFPKIEFVDVTSEILLLRAVKDKDEIDLIRSSVALCDIGQMSALKNAKVGISELELFSKVRYEMESAAGSRIPILLDFISGKRTSASGGLPTNKTIESGDLVLSDLVPCLNGYWGDSCNTFVVGKATSSQMKAFDSVKEALQIGIDAVRPGVKAMQVDKLMRAHIGDFFHHGGHGIGTVYHEEPRIVPYNDIELVPNMVIALEPGIYKEDFGIRLEHSVVVTETGCEVLTKFNHCFDQYSI
jgi:Xaa-Pro dipeptidase